ncbi:autophagy-related protein 2 homolog A-like isoform X2 [Littorina saxatilis]|uniref:Autophagy-related protein 2 n=1 Tax=Littorina saxatilis TaxID=31220 RepID=A0AAN9GD61_9CAEN
MNRILRPVKEFIGLRAGHVLERLVLYTLRKVIGEFTTLTPDQVVVNGLEIIVNDVELNPKAVNAALNDFPFEVVEGFTEQFCTTIPWGELGSSPLSLKAKGVDLTLRPRAPMNNAAQLFEEMKGSLMTASLQCMEEAFREDPKKSSSMGPMPEVSEMAAMLEKIKALVRISVEDITLRLEDVKDGNVVGLDVHVDKMEYFDDRVRDMHQADAGSDVDSDANRAPLAWMLKNVRMYNIKVNLDDDESPCNPTFIPDSTGASPSELFLSAMDEVPDGDEGPRRHMEEGEEEVERSTPVTIATLAGLTEIKIKTKEIESVEGPKVEVESHLGAVHTLLSPKQLHFVIRILSSFVAPSKSSATGSPTGAMSRRMGPEDYHRVDLALQQNILGADPFDDLTDTMGCENVLSDGQPQFFTMESMGRDEMSSSTTSVDTAGTASTKATSVFAGSTAVTDRQQRQKERTAQKVRDDRERASLDPGAERSSYHLTVATVSVCVLHEEPHDGNRKEWVSKMKALTGVYFQGVRCIPIVGQALPLAQLRDRVSAVLPRDHLGLLCKPVTVTMQDKTVHTGQSFCVDLNIGSTELVECLYDSRKAGNSFGDQEATSLPQYSEILTFPSSRTSDFDSLTGTVPTPAVRLNATINSKTGPYGYTFKQTEVCLQLGKAVVELDITMQDRLNTLLTTLSTPKQPVPQFGQSLLAGNGQSGFDEAMQDVASNTAVSLNVSCPHTTLRVRFPIPDLRPGSQHAPREWWGRNLHKESLLLEVDSLSLLRRDSPEAATSEPSVTEVMCSKLEVYFQEDFNKTPLLFGSVQQGPRDVGDNFNRPRVVVKSFPSTSNLLDALHKEEPVLESMMAGFGSVLEQDIMGGKAGATPFSVKREVTHGAAHLEGDDQEGFKSTFEKLIPGTKEECRKFVDVSSSHTSLLVEISGPKVLFLLHDKPFVELLYNRINNDLLLWEPQSPSPPETFASGLSLNVQPQFGLSGPMTQSMYQPHFDSDSDSDEYNGSPQSREGHISDNKVPFPSNLCVSVSIGEGKVFANVPIKDEEGKEEEDCHGELLLIIKEGLLFISVGHEGDKDLRYVTFNANNAKFLHAGNADNSKGHIKMEHLDALTPDNNKRFMHMADRIYRSEHSVPIAPLTSVGTGETSEDMVSVAIKIKVDSLNNNKHFCVATAVRGGTLRFEKFHQGENWISQVMELLDLTDYPIEGYVMPEVITDLHIELQGCAVDYRPKNFPLPMRALVTAQKFNLAVNLNSETHYTSLRFILEEAKLWLSCKDFMEIRLKSDYVTVAYNSLLEIGLRLGQAKEGGSHTLLWFSCSKTELAMCADSCAAFTLLIQHFLRDGDLKTAEQQAAEEQRNAEIRHCLTEAVEEDERTVAKHKQVEKMVAEALVEPPKPPTSPSDSAEREGESSRQLFFMPDDKAGAHTQWEAQQSHVQHKHSPAPSPSPSARSQLTTLTAESPEEISDFDFDENGEGFTIIDDPGLGIAPREGEPPVVRWYTTGEQTLRVNKDFLARSTASTASNDLKTPADYPTPQFKTVIREWNIDVAFYGGNDFDLPECATMADKSKEDVSGRGKGGAPPKRASVSDMWKGGVNRCHDFMTKLSLSKLRLNYETYEEEENRSRRLVLVVKSLEVQDNVKSSKYHKLLYWPNSSLGQEGSNMVCLKMMWERPFSLYSTEECSIMLTLQPLKVNINQDTLLFMQRYFANVSVFSNSMSSTQSQGVSPSPSPSPSHASSDSSGHREKKSTSREPAPILSVSAGEEEEEDGPWAGEDNLIHLDDSSPHSAKPKTKAEPSKRQDLESKDAPMFIKSFVLTRPVPLSIDYSGTASNISSKEGLKNFAVTMASGLLSLENAQIWLKDLELVKGYVGLGKLVEAIFKEWSEDIERTQKIRLIGGVPILGAFKRLGDGLYEFVTLPYVQWQRDGRIWRGFQKGASSLGSAAQLALIDLLQIVFDTLQVLSECGYDFLSSGKSVRSYRKKIGPPPKDMRDGVTEAYTFLFEGVKDTVSDLVTTASKQREQKGLAGAMGTATKEGTAMVIGTTHLAATAIRRVCTTYKYTVHPESQQEDKEKWKSHN